MVITFPCSLGQACPPPAELWVILLKRETTKVSNVTFDTPLLYMQRVEGSDQSKAHTQTHTQREGVREKGGETLHTCPGVLNSNLYSGRSSSDCLFPKSRCKSLSFFPCPSDMLSLFFLAGVAVEAWKDSTDFLFLFPSTMRGWSSNPRSAELCGGRGGQWEGVVNTKPELV